MPASPEKYAAVIEQLVKTATPKKQAALKASGITSSPTTKKKLQFYSGAMSSMKHTFEKLKKNTTSEGKHKRRVLAASLGILKKHRMMRNVSREVGICWNFLVSSSKLIEDDEVLWDARKQRKDSVSQETIKTVEDFFSRPDVSSTLPYKKRVSKKSLQEAKVLDRSIDSLYNDFREHHPTINISKSKFSSLRPGNVKTMAKNKFNQCLCEYCTNIELKLRSLNKFLDVKKKSEFKMNDRYAVSRESLCPKPGQSKHYTMKCLIRKCNDCGTKKVNDRLLPVTTESGQSQVQWFKWVSEIYVRKVGNI